MTRPKNAETQKINAAHLTDLLAILQEGTRHELRSLAVMETCSPELRKRIAVEAD